MWPDPPVYFHFLDRELGRSIDFNITPGTAEQIVKHLLLGTTAELYSGLSLAWESPSMTGPFLDFFLLLEQARAIQVVSNHPTMDEFLASRISLYHHDAARYPMYFDPQAQQASRLIGPIQFKST